MKFLRFFSKVSQYQDAKTDFYIGRGFANNSINSNIFRRSAITSFTDGKENIIRFCSYYDSKGRIVVARKINNKPWKKKTTMFSGYTGDAHNSVSLAVDGDGFVHIVWGMHNKSFSYIKSVKPYSLVFKKSSMINNLETYATYPEFYVLPSGNLLFLYRYGYSGNGRLVLNKYDIKTACWTRIHDNLISGENRISPYWQTCVDKNGCLHISWCWRESSDVKTNYNICYMRSVDGEYQNFVNSKGKVLKLPVTESNAEIIQEIPQNSMLMNQTSMTTDSDNLPYVISYWRKADIVQYQILHFDKENWVLYDTKLRDTDFDISGKGTKHLPCSRPGILIDNNKNIIVLFRDDKYDSRLMAARFYIDNNNIGLDKMFELTSQSVGTYEPNYDINLWNKTNVLSLFVQQTFDDKDVFDKTNNKTNILSTPVYIVDYKI